MCRKARSLQFLRPTNATFNTLFRKNIMNESNDHDDLAFLKTLNILYVEDEIIIRKQLAQFLNRRCANLYIGTNGKEGLAIFQDCQPDLVISDVLMPEMDGLKMGEAIRAINPKIPIILTTAFEEPSYFHRAIDLSVDKYVVKPIDLLILEEALLKCARTLRAELALYELQQRTAELMELQRIAAVVFEAQEGMFVTDADTTILRVNKAFSEITGYPAEEMVGKTPHVLQSGRQDCHFYEEMWSGINQDGHWKGEIWNKRKNGEIYPENICVTAVKDDDGNVTNYVATFMDITINKAIADEIKHLAFYDPLTNLPNRRLLFDRLKIAFASNKRNGKKGAVLFIDMDNFKTLNDTLGHDMGDLLLKEVAERLHHCVRDCDTVARFGGDEFVIMLTNLNEDEDMAINQAEIIGQKILVTLNKSYQLRTQDYSSTPSIGVAIFTGHESSIHEPVKQADTAMYQAKKAGRNTLRFFKNI